MFVPIVEQLARARFVAPRGAPGDTTPFSRLIVEKPIGRDLASAQAINDAIAKVFDERQIYRIDHYLGKETVQNILVLRFANSIFEPLFNQKYVDHVQITVAEEEGVGTRARYYEQAGALRDMVQNHLLQLLALIGMEPPHSLDADVVRDEKLEMTAGRCVRSRARRWTRRSCAAQYAAGFVFGKPVPGYRDEPGVARDSRTETFVALQLFIDNWRWAGRAVFSAHRQAAAEARERNQRAAERRPAHSLQPGPLGATGLERPDRPNSARRRVCARHQFEDSGAARPHLPGEDGLPLQQYVRRHLTRGVRAIAARRHGWRSDVVHAPGRGGDGMAVGDADSRAVGGAGERAAADLPGRRVGTTRGRPPHRGDRDGNGDRCNKACAAPSAAETVDDDLAALWREIARTAPVSRAVMSNLVVYCRRAAGDDVDLASPPEGVPIDEVARHHPARVILLHHDPDASGQNDESVAHRSAR